MTRKNGFVIAIDGTAGSGKSTVARALAAKLGYLYIDTGAMYRCIALAVQRRGIDVGDKAAIVKVSQEVNLHLEVTDVGLRVYLDDEEVENLIRDPAISRLTSKYVANIPGVRDAMLVRQRKLGENGGVVMEGRDIGTEVFPQADLKIFFVVSPTERAKRRINDFEARGITFDPEQVIKDLEHRDFEDMNRPRGALKKASDSIEILGDGKTVEALVEEIAGLLPKAKKA